MAKTAITATGFRGEKPYQKRARRALPILIRQAKAEQTISYTDLATELGMSNPRTLNFPLGCIGKELNRLGRVWRSEIPHIQALVVSKGTSVPGTGFDEFLRGRGRTWNSPEDRKAIMENYVSEIAHYPHWDRVLAELKLEPATSKLDAVIEKATSRRGGEGPEHRALKEFVSQHPNCVGLSARSAEGLVEAPLPSGDSIDVLFHRPSRIVAVEVKPTHAPLHDISRGLFQCVKYRAVLQARADFQSDVRKIDAFLVLGGAFPKELFPLKNSLGVVVFEHVGS